MSSGEIRDGLLPGETLGEAFDRKNNAAFEFQHKMRINAVVDAARVTVSRHRWRFCREPDCSLCALGTALDALDNQR